MRLDEYELHIWNEESTVKKFILELLHNGKINEDFKDMIRIIKHGSRDVLDNLEEICQISQDNIFDLVKNNKMITGASLEICFDNFYALWKLSPLKNKITTDFTGTAFKKYDEPFFSLCFFYQEVEGLKMRQKEIEMNSDFLLPLIAEKIYAERCRSHFIDWANS